MVKERRTNAELRQILWDAVSSSEECWDLEDLFIFGPVARAEGNWGFGLAGKRNAVSLSCYARLNDVATRLQRRYELNPVKATQAEIEARLRALIQDSPTLWGAAETAGGIFKFGQFKSLAGQPNWTIDWSTDSDFVRAVCQRIVRSLQTQFELE
jgi:hypothetical protein